MGEFFNVLVFAALPAAGNFIGGLLSELFAVSRRTLSLALHAAAGIVLAVIGIELMPEALAVDPPWVIILAFMAGGGFFILMDQIIDLVQSRRGTAGGDTGAWAIYFGVAIDLFSDGVMIGTGATIDLGLGLLLALGQVPADIPEGFATIAALQNRGIARRTRILAALSLTLPILLGTTIGYWVVRGQPVVVKLALLAFTAGILLSVVVEEIMPEAHEEEDARLATMLLVTGFALFALITVYFE